MTPDPDQLRAHMHSAAALLALPITPAQEPGVLLNLQRIAVLAAVVNEFVLREDIEPAPVFKQA